MKKEYVFQVDVHVVLDNGEEFEFPSSIHNIKSAFVSATNDLLDNSYIFDALQEQTELDVCSIEIK